MCVNFIGFFSTLLELTEKIIVFVDFQAIGVLPDQSMIRALQRIAWSSCAAGLQLVHAPYDQIHQAVDQLHGCVIGGEGDRLVPDVDDVAVCRESLEVLSVCLALCPEAVDVLFKERIWQTFIIDVLLVCHNRLLLTVESWLLGIAPACCNSPIQSVNFCACHGDTKQSVADTFQWKTFGTRMTQLTLVSRCWYSVAVDQILCWITCYSE